MQITKEKLHEIIFEADTPKGKAFDVALLILIFLSLIVVMLESVDYIRETYHYLLFTLEWIFTIAFSIEYFIRIYIVKKPLKYIFSFYGLVDLIAILPTYFALFTLNQPGLIAVRSLRLLRSFRVLKLVHFFNEAQTLYNALKSSSRKIFVFLVGILTFTVIFGSIMYQIEGPEHGFTSIPRSIYWAIVTLTTVGYGDISPVTPLGQFLASIIMILGYGIIAVPTGLVTADLLKAKPHITTRSCTSCSLEGHDLDAKHCKYCGEKL